MGEWLVFKSDGSARCENKKYCKRFDNWHWRSAHQRCDRQFSQGPGKKGNRAAINYFPKTSYIDFNNESITVQDSIESKLKVLKNHILNKKEFEDTFLFQNINVTFCDLH